MIKSLKMGTIGNWLVKASMWNNETICIIMFNVGNQQCYTNFFKTQSDAQQFITRVATDQ